METLILFSSKYGATKEVANKISTHFPQAEVQDIKELGNLDITRYDSIIIGSSIYAGVVNKEIKDFISTNQSELKNKTWAVFFCGLNPKTKDEVVKNNFPGGELNSAKVITYLGGLFEAKKANFFEKTLISALTKQKGDVDMRNEEELVEFVKEFKSQDCSRK